MNGGAPHRWQIVRELMVSFTISGMINDDLWARFVTDVSSQPVTRMLCATMGDVEVTSLQRKLCAEACKRKELPLAVVADSRIVRGMVTAVSWLGVDIKAFSWDEVPQAVQHLKVTTLTEPRAIEIVRRFRTESG